MMEALTTVDPVPFDSLPRNRIGKVIASGYWSTQHLPGSNAPWPPLPGNFWGLDVWPLGDGVFILDDRNVDYAAIQAEVEMASSPMMSMMMSSLSSSYAYGNPVYLTNLVVTSSGGMSATFDIAGGTKNVPYDIVMTTNLLGSWNWLGIGYTSNRYSFNTQPSDVAFYRLAKPSQTMAVGWGGDIYTQCDVPLGTTNLLMVSGAYGYSLGLLSDGTVIGWGSSGVAGWVPTNLVGNVAMIAAAWNHNVALLTNGTVTAWGFNGAGFGWHLTEVPADLTNATVISAQALHTLTLRKDGTVVAWGYNGSGQTNVPAGLTNVTAIAAGGNHSLAVSNGYVVAWGNNAYGQRIVPANLSNVWDVAASDYHSLALKMNGTVVAWGDNAYGESTVPTGLSNVVAIAAGGSPNASDAYMGAPLPYSLALKKDGSLISWGAGLVNRPVQGFNNVIGISGGLFHALAIRTGPPTPVITLEPTNKYQIAGGSVTFAAKGAGLYGVTYQWQTNSVNLSGATNATLTLTNVQAAQAGVYNVVVTDNTGMGNITSSNASFYLVTPPVITYQSQPTNVVCIYGNHVALAAMATALYQTNGFPVTYQWKLNGTNIPGMTTTNHAFFVADNSGGTYSFTAANAAGSTNVSWQVSLTNAINVTNDLLLIYNTNSADSAFVKDYYLANRPLVGGANVLGIGYTNATSPGYYETISPTDLTNLVLSPVGAWLANNPTKRPQYVILFLDMPSRVFTDTSFPTNGNYPRATPIPSVSVQLRSVAMDWQPLVTHINMNGTNDCIAYINKVAFFGTNNSLIISASAGGYGNTNYALDNVRHGTGYFGSENYSTFGYYMSDATNGLLTSGISPSAIIYKEGLDTITNGIHYDFPHLTNAMNVAGYMSWGQHSSLGSQYATNAAVQWSGNSSWWIIETFESFNGLRFYDGQGNFVKWFSANAFGGTNYSNAPIGAVSNVDEPTLFGSNDPTLYFSFWAVGKNFAICAWKSRNTDYFQAVGDPFVTK